MLPDEVVPDACCSSWRALPGCVEGIEGPTSHWGGIQGSCLPVERSAADEARTVGGIVRPALGDSRPGFDIVIEDEVVGDDRCG